MQMPCNQGIARRRGSGRSTSRHVGVSNAQVCVHTNRWGARGAGPAQHALGDGGAKAASRALRWQSSDKAQLITHAGDRKRKEKLH